jgi:alkylation response protein AidB-like acyl-CoA dehydrogenase
MQYDLTEEQIMMQDTVRRIATDKLAPGAGDRDDNKFAWDAKKILEENGIFGCDFKEEYGGAEMGALALALAGEELAKVCASSSTILLVHELGSMPIMLGGSEEQNKKWMPGLASGEKLIAFGLTEPGAGSDAAGIRTRALKKSDMYILNGTKQFISHADVADYICIAAVTDPDKPVHKGGLSVIVVEKDAPGISIGKHEEKMGIRGSSTCEIIMEDCEVPVENLLANEGDGFHILMKTLDFTRPCVAAQALGIAQGALDFAVAYAKERHQFGKPIINFQGLNWMLADMDTQVEAARQWVYKTCAVLEQTPK